MKKYPAPTKPAKDNMERVVEIPQPRNNERQVAALVPKQKKVGIPDLSEPDIFKNAGYYFNRAIFFSSQEIGKKLWQIMLKLQG